MDQVLANPNGTDEELAGRPGRLQVVLTVALLSLVVWSLFVIRDRVSPGRAESKQLQGGNPRERRRAAREMATLGPRSFPGVATALMTALEKDTDAIVRTESARALGATADRFLKNGEESELIEQAIVTLVKGLADIDSNVRESSASALTPFAKIKDGPPDELVKLLISDPEVDVQTAAAGAISRYKVVSPQGVRYLLEGVHAKEIDTRRLCSVVLGQVLATKESLPDLALAIESPHMEVRCRASDLLARLGEASVETVPGLIRNLSIRLKTEPGVNHTLFDPAVSSAYALGRIAPKTPLAAKAVEALCVNIRDPDVARVESASNALVQFGDLAGTSVPILHEALKEAVTPPNDLPAGASLAAALGELAPKTPLAEQVVPTLTLALHSKSDMTRSRTVSALTRFGKLALPALPRLQELLRDRNIPVRFEANRAVSLLSALKPQ